MSDKCNKSIWTAIASLGISLIFAARKSRRKEAIEKAERKAEELRKVLEGMKSKND